MNKIKMTFALLLLFIVVAGGSTVFADDVSSSNGGTIYNITSGSNSSTIQNTINNMNDGDILSFENGTYNDICIYINKNITVYGNGAILNGYSSPGVNNSNIPEVIRNSTTTGGYGIAQFATLYIVNTNNLTLKDLTLSGLRTEYSDCVIYAQNNNKMKIENCTVSGSSWGLYILTSKDSEILNNYVKNQVTTGILNFQSPRTLIKNNTVVNATNHGIDVRHGTGPNVVVTGNTVISANEGIYIMHSGSQTVINNTVINCTLSGISFYGSFESKAENNTFIGGRTAFLLGGGFYNITIGENNYQLANLPYPPTFVYYIGMSESPYQSADDVIGVYSDGSSYNNTYSSDVNIPDEKDIEIDVDDLEKETGTVYTVLKGTTSDQIQTMIDSMNDGDTLVFENGIYENICIYTDKNIKILGNGATLRGYENANLSYVPSKIKDKTDDGGYGIAQIAVLYIVNNTNVVIANLNVEGLCPGYNENTVNGTTMEYKTVDIFAQSSNNISIINCNVTGNSWGIYLNLCANGTIFNNSVSDVYTTGIMNFGSPNTLIVNNTVTDAINHGIDVRHGSGPNVTVTGNTITGAKEGIYLMHSKGHKVYNNTIINSKISGITAYGSGNEYIYNNTIEGSRAGILIGGGYYNVTIGRNNFKLSSLPFPPTFSHYLIQAESQYQKSTVTGTFSDISKNPSAVIIVDDVKANENEDISLTATLKDNQGIGVENTKLIFTVNGVNTTGTTNSEGKATVNIGKLAAGTYTVRATFEGNDKLNKHYEEFTLTVLPSEIIYTLESKDITKYYKNSTQYTVTVKDQYNNTVPNAKVTVYLDGKSFKNLKYTITSNNDGIATLDINLAAGDYSIKAVLGNCTIYNKITVLKIKFNLEASDVSKFFNDKTPYTVKVTDYDHGNVIANEAVTISLGSSSWSKPATYKIVTNGDGVATLSINLNPGSYSIKAAVDTASKTNAIIIIKVTYNMKADSFTKYFKNDTQYHVKVTDLNGVAVANTTLSVSISSSSWKKAVTYKITTNDEGVATLNIGLAAGTYTMTASLGGNSVKSTVKVLPTLTASSITKKVSQSASLKAKLVDGQGKPVSGGTVTFKVLSKTYTKTTDSSGYASLPINLHVGTWTLTIANPTTGATTKATVKVIK